MFIIYVNYKMASEQSIGMGSVHFIQFITLVDRGREVSGIRSGRY